MADEHIIIAGQSNALGYLNTGPAPYTPTAQVQIWALQPDGSYAWNYMRPGVNTGAAANPSDWGPEVQIANDWLKLHAGDGSYLWIVKVAKGSTGLAEDAGQLDWSPHSTGEMFDIATGEIDQAMHNLDGSRFAFDHYDTLDWMQGETDAEDAAKAGAYAANVREFITDARAAWHVQDVAVARISALDEPYSLTVRQAEWNLDNGDAPMPGVVSFKTIGFEMQPDQLHYDAVGHVQLGDAFFSAWTI